MNIITTFLGLLVMAQYGVALATNFQNIHNSVYLEFNDTEIIKEFNLARRDRVRDYVIEDRHQIRNGYRDDSVDGFTFRSEYNTSPTKLRYGAKMSYSLADQIVEVAKLVNKYALEDEDGNNTQLIDSVGNVLRSLFENDIFGNVALGYLNRRLVSNAQLMIDAASSYPSRESDVLLYDVCKSLKRLKVKSYALASTLFIPNSDGVESSLELSNFFEVADEIEEIKTSYTGC